MSPMVALKQAGQDVVSKEVAWCRGPACHTSVPGTSELSVVSEDSLDKRRAVVGALGTECLDLSSSIEQQDLGAVHALDLNLLLIAWLEVQRGHSLELVFLCRHVSRGCREGSEGCSCCCCRRWVEQAGRH